MKTEASVEKIRVTNKDLSASTGLDSVLVYGLMKFLEKIGVAKPVDSRSVPGQKGKPSVVYELPKTITIQFHQD